MTFVVIEQFDTAMKYPEMLAECLQKAKQYSESADTVIWPSERAHTGWLEWRLHINFHKAPQMTIGAIQRSPSDIFEFHT
jgi:hypothetical protein